MKSRFVEKPWGFEEIWAETDKYLGKFLYIKAGHRLSRQYHNQKDETIRVIRGILKLEIGQENSTTVFTLGEGEVYHILPLTIHRFCAESNDVVLAEVSTPEIDDVIRLDDDYKR